MSQFSVAVKCWVELQEPASKCLKMSTLDMEDFPWLVVEMLEILVILYSFKKQYFKPSSWIFILIYMIQCEKFPFNRA